MKKRIFAALGISMELQEEILSFERAFSALPVRWIEGKNLHITLVPPWYEEDADAALKKLERARNAGAFNVYFRSVSYGPNQKFPRLIWAEGEAPGALIAIKREAHKALGIPEEKRPLLLHLTLARFRPEEFSSFKIKSLNEKVSWSDTISSVMLMESHLASSGADYKIIGGFPLARY